MGSKLTIPVSLALLGSWLLVWAGMVQGQPMCKIVDEKGKVTYTQGPCMNGTAVQNRMSSGATVCDEACRQAAAQASVARGSVDASGCSFAYYKGDARGQRLAAAAKQECLTNKAMKESGSKAYRPSTEAAREWEAYDKEADARVQREEQTRLMRQQVIQQQQTNQTLQQIQRDTRVPVVCVGQGRDMRCY